MIQAYRLNSSEVTFEKIESGNILLTHIMKRTPPEQGPNAKISDYLMFPLQHQNVLNEISKQDDKTKTC